MEPLESLTANETGKLEERMKWLKKEIRTSKVVDGALWAFMGAALLGGLYLNISERKELLERATQQCESVQSKEQIRNTPLGRYSCSEIEDLYSHQPPIYGIL